MYLVKFHMKYMINKLLKEMYMYMSIAFRVFHLFYTNHFSLSIKCRLIITDANT